MDKWIPQRMTKIKGDKIASYQAYICPECSNEQIVRTNYCSRCGTYMYTEGDASQPTNSVKFSDQCGSCAYFAIPLSDESVCSILQPCSTCFNRHGNTCNCLKHANPKAISCPYYEEVNDE